MAVCQIKNVTIKGETTEVINKKKAVIDNMLENLSDHAFVDVLYAKITKNPRFFTELANNPLLKMFN